jgi:peptide/nickel transport system substrate-binding protein
VLLTARNRNSGWVKAALVVAAVLLGGTPGMAETPQRGGTLVYAVLGDPTTYDCHAATSFAVLHYVAPHYSLLVKLDPDNTAEITGDLAESWTVSPDRLTWTFKLHPNAVFHNGDPVTSEDVKASFDRLRHPPAGVVSVRQSQFAGIAVIETPDPHTVVFRTATASPAFVGALASPFNCLYSAAKLREDPNFPAKNVMGSGPFVFAEHAAGSHWLAKRFDRYFREGLPYLDGFRAVQTSSANLATALQGGQVMAEFRSVSPAVRDRLVSTLGEKISVYEKPYAFGVLVHFNTKKKPFDDPRVRRALSLAVDRWAAAESLQRSTTMRYVGGTQRPGSPWATPDEVLATMPGFGHDIRAARDEAKRLLKEAGVPNLTFKLTNRNIADPYTATGVYLIDQWRQIGVNVEHQQVDVAQLQSAMASGGFEAIVDFKGEVYDDPTIELARHLSVDRSSYNPAGYIDRKIDDLFDRQDQATDPAERKRLVVELERHLFSEAYSVPFLWLNRIVVMSSAVKGWKMTPTHLINQDLGPVWLASH